MTEYFINVFDLSGIYKGRVSFTGIKEEYGEPIRCSNNAKVWLFKNTEKDKEIVDGYLVEKLENVEFHIFTLESEGFVFAKTVNFEESIAKWLGFDIVE
jgi:hypothetical protein